MPSSRLEERRLIAEISDRAALRKRAAEPEVGIFWLYRGRPIVDGTPLSESERYGAMINYTGDHARFWETLQRNRLVPRDVEYDEVPRGRVLYNTSTRKFTMLADRCILGNKAAVRRMRELFHLPPSTETGTDPHYRCERCARPPED